MGFTEIFALRQCLPTGLMCWHSRYSKLGLSDRGYQMANPVGSVQYLGRHTIWNSSIAQQGVLAYMLGGSNLSSPEKTKEMSQDG